MNRERAKELLPVIQAYADGKDVQFKLHGEGEEWEDDWPEPSFDSGMDWRIKPEPKEYWVLRNESGHTLPTWDTTKADCIAHKKECGFNGYEPVLLREVIE